MHYSRKTSALFAGALSLVSTQALAAAFALHEQNAALLGGFYAGSAAIAEDASTNWYNPAGLTQLNGWNIVVTGLGVWTQVDFEGSTSLQTIGLPGGPYIQTGSAEAGTDNFVPALHVSYKVNDKWAVGFSVVTPFGLSTEYGEDSIARYNATDSELMTIDFTPSVAYQALDWLSLGVGFDAEYATGKFNGTIGVSTPGACGGSERDSCDSESENTGTGWGFGWHAGILAVVPQTGTHLGLTFHSNIEQDLSGTSKLEGPLNLSGAESDLSSSADLPWWIVASVTHEFNEQFTVLGSVEYTHWSSIAELALDGVQTGNGGTTTSVDELNYANAWGFFGGLRYSPIKSVMLSVGGGYEQTPTNDTDRDLRVPDSNRWIASAGIRYLPESFKTLQFDLGYAHVWGEEVDVNKTMASDTQVVKANGEVNAGVDILGGQITIKI
jgi:long-chain fatty acid transport protein